MPPTTSSSPPPSGMIIFAAALLRPALSRGLRSGAPARTWGRLHRPWCPPWHPAVPPWRRRCRRRLVVVIVVVVVPLRLGVGDAALPPKHFAADRVLPPPAEVLPPIPCPNWIGGRKREGRVRRSSDSCRSHGSEGTPLLGWSAARHALFVRARCSQHYSAGTQSSSNAAVSSLADEAIEV